ncbi:MAG: hypothetical protein LAP21_12155 [Acidobacteriia bacterium]|nr:hypothetical protein [Terriglobia bacterium]
MLRLALSILLIFSALTAAAFEEVHTVGDVSFSVPDGWKYQQGVDFAAMALTRDKNFWLMAVYTPMPSSGDASQDVKAAWTRIVLPGKDYQGYPALPYYDINHTVGYPGRRADDSNINRSTYTRLYVLEAGKSFIPVVAVSNDGMVLNAMEHVANTLIGSVRLAPLKAEPVKTTLTVADLAGHWIHGAASSYDFYNRQTGRYESNASAFYGAGYTIAANGSFTYQMSGMVNGRTARDDDSGVVELGGEFVVFKGHNHVVRYRFLNLQQALNGATVLTLLPPAADINTLSIVRDGDMWSRAPKR